MREICLSGSMSVLARTGQFSDTGFGIFDV
jgi:hypothetical protein